MDSEKLNRAAQLEAEARDLRRQAHAERPLPDFWRVGQKVRTLADKAWAWKAGDVMTITELRDEGTPALDYQVFWTAHAREFGRFWTTPDEVELVEDADAKPPHKRRKVRI
jgi:hypothetical protein